MYCVQGKKKVTSLEILFAMKFIIQAKLPTEEYVPPHFHVLSILISDYYAKFTEVIISLLKGLHLQQKNELFRSKETQISTELSLVLNLFHLISFIV